MSESNATHTDHASAMSKYEREAWEALTAKVSAREERGRFGMPGAVRRASELVAARTRQIPKYDEAASAVNAAIGKALTGLHGLTVDMGLNSVRPETVVKRFQKAGHPVETLTDIHSLDLRAADAVGANKKQRYMLAGLVEGGASSFAVTGATVATTVSGGVTVGVAAGAVAADTVTVLGGMGRIIASIAANYGYDTRLPEEQLFASGVLAYSSAQNATEKAAAMAALSRLTQDMMRRATWKQLSSHHLVKVIEQIFKGVGVRLTHRKLGQAVPVLGVAMNGGMNVKFVNDTYERAQEAYRLRFLTEKYDLDPGAWRPVAPSDPAGSGDIPLIDEVIDAELEE